MLRDLVHIGERGFLGLCCDLNYIIRIVKLVILLKIPVSVNLLESNIFQEPGEMVLAQWKHCEVMDRSIGIGILQPDEIVSDETRLDVNCIPYIVIFVLTAESSIQQ